MTDSVAVPVAARYDIAVTRFEVRKTRAKTRDTIKISLRSQLQGQSHGDSLCNIVGSNFCAISVPQGDFETGDTISGPHTAKVVQVNNVRAGPFDLIPEVSDNLLFEYDVMNLGVSYDQTATQAILDSSSQLASGILDALAKDDQNFDALNKWAQGINGLEQCDGPVAVDARRFLNKSDPNLPGIPTLDSATRGTGRFAPDATEFAGTDSGIGCGENSLYRVNWTLFRTSWQP